VEPVTASFLGSKRIRTGEARDPQLVLSLLVIRFKVGIRSRPVFEVGAFRVSVTGSHSEVLFMKTPRRGSVPGSSAAHLEGIEARGRDGSAAAQFIVSRIASRKLPALLEHYSPAWASSWATIPPAAPDPTTTALTLWAMVSDVSSPDSRSFSNWRYPGCRRTWVSVISLHRVPQNQIKERSAAVRAFGGARRVDVLAPTILTDITPQNPFHQESFAPVAMIPRVNNEKEAIDLANDSPYGLGGSVITKNVEWGKRVARQIETGMVFINSAAWTTPDLPFGGVKNSGYGRELSELGIGEFVNKKLIRVAA
jgi:Aldehyde dehydrogenase family